MSKSMENICMETVLDIITALDQSKSWEKTLASDPFVKKADKDFNAALEELEAVVSIEMSDRISSASCDCVAANQNAAMLFGMQVAFGLMAAASKPEDLGQYIVSKMEGNA